MGRRAGRKPGARERYEALTPEQRAQVDAIFAPDVARGWIPKETDIQAAIDAVLGAGGEADA